MKECYAVVWIEQAGMCPTCGQDRGEVLTLDPIVFSSRSAADAHGKGRCGQTANGVGNLSVRWNYISGLVVSDRNGAHVPRWASEIKRQDLLELICEELRHRAEGTPF